MADTVYKRSLASDFGGFVDPEALAVSVDESAIGTPLSDSRIRVDGDVVCGTFSSPLSSGDEAIFYALAEGNSLMAAKSKKIVAFERRTRELVDAGFPYSGKQLSLAFAVQTRMSNSYILRNDSAVAYPLHWDSFDSLDTFSIVSAASMAPIYLASQVANRGILNGEAQLKAAARAATTLAEVAAVVDLR